MTHLNIVFEKKHEFKCPEIFQTDFRSFFQPILIAELSSLLSVWSRTKQPYELIAIILIECELRQNFQDIFLFFYTSI